MSHRVGRLAYDGLTHGVVTIRRTLSDEIVTWCRLYGVVTIRRTLSDEIVTWCRLSVGGLQMRGAVYYPTYEDATMPVDCIACLANEPVTHPPIVAVFTV